MYCPFDHPLDGEASTLEEWEAQKDWLVAASEDNLEKLEVHIKERTVKVDHCFEPGTKDVKIALVGKTALSFMLKRGNIEGTKLLLKARASLKRHQHETMSPLFAAIMPAQGKKVEEIVELLLNAKADIKEQEPSLGQFVLHHSVVRNPEMIPYLVRKGAPVNVKSNTGVSPLQNALSMKDVHTVTVEHLLSKKASPRTQADPIKLPGSGSTPLGIASKKGLTDICQMLMKQGAELDGNSYVGSMLLDDDGAMLSEWESKGATPLSRNMDGAIALHVASALKGQQIQPSEGGKPAVAEGVVDRLLAWHQEHGSLEQAVNTKDKKGITPIMVASRNQNGEVCKALNPNPNPNPNPNTNERSVRLSLMPRRTAMHKILTAIPRVTIPLSLRIACGSSEF